VLREPKVASAYSKECI